MHMKYVTFIMFRQKINDIKDLKLNNHFKNMCNLIGLLYLNESMTNGYDCGYYKGGDQILIEEALKIILNKLRPQAIPLIELY